MKTIYIDMRGAQAWQFMNIASTRPKQPSVACCSITLPTAGSLAESPGYHSQYKTWRIGIGKRTTPEKKRYFRIP